MSLLERTIRALAQEGVDEIAIIVNETMAPVAQFVQNLELAIPCTW